MDVGFETYYRTQHEYHESYYYLPQGLLFSDSWAYLASISCRSHSNVEAPDNNTQSAAEYVAQADQLYAQREDLVRGRQTIILPQQALITDPADYDATWRLAKFNYYLATHTPNSDERDKALGEARKLLDKTG